MSASSSYCRAEPARELTVEHLGLRAQAVTLLNEVVDFLATLQNTLDSLVERNLGLIPVRSANMCEGGRAVRSYLVQFLLDLHNAVRLLWVLFSC